MTLSKQKVLSSYQSGAKYYDFAVQLYGLIGIRKAYRLRTIKHLHLKRGDCVVELGCGTGLNFSPIVKQIGPEGRLIGVDLSPKMLAHAQKRAERAGWKNIEFVQSDILAYNFPESINGVLSIGVFGYIADCDRVIKAASHALVLDGRLAIMDGKRPERLPSWVFKLIVRASRSFGVTNDYFDKRTWESVERHFRETAFEQMYGGMLYISSGTAA
ncbi:MAG: methyltransferase domain-containing protein [Deltaproteobacteria bacterium]|nr:MAG: methyltransferase domain-containing protein [Deltaproteobacteria bacterium]